MYFSSQEWFPLAFLFLFKVLVARHGHLSSPPITLTTHWLFVGKAHGILAAMEKVQNIFASLTGQEKVGLIDPSLWSLYGEAQAQAPRDWRG